MTSKTALVLATTAAIALGGFEMRPAAAAPEGGPAIVKQNAGADEFSSQRKRRRARGVHPAVPLAAFGALIGTIGAVAAQQRQRDYYYYDDEPQYVGPPAYYYAQPQPYVRNDYYAPRHHYAPRRHYAPQPHVRHHGPGAVGRLHPDPHQRGPLQGQPGHAPARAPEAAPNDGRL